jgi:hypothetical protein
MPYNREQREALQIVRRYLDALTADERIALSARIGAYLSFREALEKFLSEHFSEICTAACFRSRLSACCTKEGIVAFFGDVVVNTLVSSAAELDEMERALDGDSQGFKCVFLSEKGCLWRVRPIVCAMFLCDPAAEKAWAKSPEAAARWKTFQARRNDFTWPDKPVLFDDLEQHFIDAGFRSPLMYLHQSPGLLRVKKAAGLLPER